VWNIKGTVLNVIVLSFPSFGAIVSLEFGIQPNEKVYKITISQFLECPCLDFVNMVVASIGNQGQYVNCKYLYYIFCYFCKDDKFIHSLSFSFNP
jgi:hypothetical protein